MGQSPFGDSPFNLLYLLPIPLQKIINQRINIIRPNRPGKLLDKATQINRRRQAVEPFLFDTIKMKATDLGPISDISK